MDRRAFLRMGACTTAGILTGFGLPLGALPERAFARGASSAESEKAKRIFEQMGASEKGEQRTAQKGIFTMNPGDVLTFEGNCYCLDGNLAIPSNNEPMAFRPMQNYIAPELRGLYVALMQSVGKSVPQGIDVQQIVYAIRSPAFEHSSLLDAKDYNFLDSLLPGAENILKRAPRPLEFTFKPGLRFWASKPKPSEIQSYSMLRDDGVAGRGLGAGVLSMRGTIANGSAKPFVFNPTQWVLESSRDVQAAAVPAFQVSFVAKGKALAAGQRTDSGPSAAPTAPSPHPKTAPSPSPAKPGKTPPSQDKYIINATDL